MLLPHRFTCFATSSRLDIYVTMTVCFEHLIPLTNQDSPGLGFVKGGGGEKFKPFL